MATPLRATANRSADLVVIGGGAGGLAAARAAARRGATVTLVQLGPLGGDCTFTGCVASKALIDAAHRREPFERDRGDPARRQGDRRHRDRRRARPRRGRGRTWVGRAPGSRLVDVDGTAIRSPRVVIATGARPAVPPIEGLADADYLTNETVWELDALPSSLAVLGGGASGCELAQAFARLGSAVSVIESASTSTVPKWNSSGMGPSVILYWKRRGCRRP